MSSVYYFFFGVLVGAIGAAAICQLAAVEAIRDALRRGQREGRQMAMMADEGKRYDAKDMYDA